MKKNTTCIAANVEPKECEMFVQSTKIGTHENKAIHSIWLPSYGSMVFLSTSVSYHMYSCNVHSNDVI